MDGDFRIGCRDLRCLGDSVDDLFEQEQEKKRKQHTEICDEKLGYKRLDAKEYRRKYFESLVFENLGEVGFDEFKGVDLPERKYKDGYFKWVRVPDGDKTIEGFVWGIFYSKKKEASYLYVLLEDGSIFEKELKLVNTKKLGLR